MHTTQRRQGAIQLADPGEWAIHTERLAKTYTGADAPAVEALDLDVYTGEIFGLLGPNGAGKTTTAGMLTTRVIPTSGRGFVGGIDIAAHPSLAKQVTGIVSQQNTLDRALTVRENLYFHGRLFGFSARRRAPPQLSCWSSSSSAHRPIAPSSRCPAGWRNA